MISFVFLVFSTLLFFKVQFETSVGFDLNKLNTRGIFGFLMFFGAKEVGCYENRRVRRGPCHSPSHSLSPSVSLPKKA